MSEQMRKACPCCAGDMMVWERHALNTTWQPIIGYRARCQQCRLSTDDYPTEAAAIAAWNQRARSHLAEMIAGGCGHRGPIHTNECSDECGWFAFWDTDNDADFENRVNCCATEEEAIVALLEKTRAELTTLRAQLIATQDSREKAETEMDRLNEIVGRQHAELTRLRSRKANYRRLRRLEKAIKQVIYHGRKRGQW